jgi:hypothetical protein
LKLDCSFFCEDEKFKAEEMVGLDDSFIEEEIKNAVFESYLDAAPDPDGLSFIFYQKF